MKDPLPDPPVWPDTPSVVDVLDEASGLCRRCGRHPRWKRSDWCAVCVDASCCSKRWPLCGHPLALKDTAARLTALADRPAPTATITPRPRKKGRRR